MGSPLDVINVRRETLLGTRRRGLGQILLNETRAEVYVELYQRRIADRAKTVDLAGLDDEDVTGAGLELLSVHGPTAASVLHELNLVVRVAMRPRPTPRSSIEQKDGDVHVAVLGADEVMRAAAKGKFFLVYAVHGGVAPVERSGRYRGGGLISAWMRSYLAV